MKKLFSKLESKAETNNKDVVSCLGKSFMIGKMVVTVEDILAEGMLLVFIT